MFSKSCEYGIKAVVYIAQQSLQNERVRVNDIAKEIDSPTAFTAKTLQILSKEKIITSVMGYAGGYEINRSQLEKLTILDIVKIIDGDLVYNGCGLGLKKCNDKEPCPIHNEYAKIRSDLKRMLGKTTILSLVTNLDNGEVYLKRLETVD
jgi:Rrf2 family transcriptional regulator, iron-sulfur cluster assembly transcription factor